MTKVLWLKWRVHHLVVPQFIQTPVALDVTTAVQDVAHAVAVMIN
jgi:hypothetical protein